MLMTHKEDRKALCIAPKSRFTRLVEASTILIYLKVFLVAGLDYFHFDI